MGGFCIMSYDKDFELFSGLLDLIYDFNDSYENLNISIKGDESDCNRLMIVVNRNSSAYERFERLANREKQNSDKFEIALDKGQKFICIYKKK